MRFLIQTFGPVALCAGKSPFTPRRVIRPLILGLAGWLAVGPALATTYYWDTNGTTAGSGAANAGSSASWDSGVSAFWTTDSTGASATSAVTTAATDDVIFSAGGNGTAGTVTVSGTQVANTLTLNQTGLTLSGGTINLSSGASGTLTVNSSAAIASVLNTKTITFGAANQTLTLSGGSGASVLFNAGINGTTTNGATSTLLLTNGAYFANGNIQIGDATNGSGGVIVSTGATYSTTATLQLAQGGSALFRVSGGTVNANSINGINLGRGGVKARFIVDSGTVNIGVTSGAKSTDVAARIGFNGTVGQFDINSGTVAATGFAAINDPFFNASGSVNNQLNVNGGTATFSAILMNGSNSAFAAASGSAVLNVAGGALYLGSADANTVTTPGGTLHPSGIYNFGTGTATAAVNLSGGTLGATADWSSGSTVALTLTNTNGGIIFKAADAANVAHNITLNGVLSGAGGLTKTGGGVLNLIGVNTYTGGTVISAGTAATGATGTFGNGDIRVNTGGVLTLGNATSIADAANVVFDTGATINLNFSGTETINSLSSVSGTFVAAGTGYDAGTLNGILGGTYFAGTGLLTITSSAIPEPSTYALWLGGMAFVGVMVLRRKNSLK